MSYGIKPEDAPTLASMAKSTAGCIDLDRVKVIGDVIQGDLERAYRMGYAAGVKDMGDDQVAEARSR